MKSMKSWMAMLGFASVMAGTQTAAAQEIQITGPLAGAPSCRRCTLYRHGRFTLTPTIGFSLQDDFDRSFVLGLDAKYHFTDIVALGAWFGGVAVHIPTDLTNQVQASASSGLPSTVNIPDRANFANQVGHLNWVLSIPQVTLIPLRGKLALFQNVFIDTDFYLFAGLGLVGIGQRGDTEFPVSQDATADDVLASAARKNALRVTGTFGVGLNFYINRFLSLGFEWRAVPFAWNNSGTDEASSASTCFNARTRASDTACGGTPDYIVYGDSNGGGRYIINSTDNTFRFNQMVNLTFSVYLPIRPRVAD